MRTSGVKSAGKASEDPSKLLSALDALYLKSGSDVDEASLVKTRDLIVQDIDRFIEKSDISLCETILKAANRAPFSIRMSILQSFIHHHITSPPLDKFITNLAFY